MAHLDTPSSHYRIGGPDRLSPRSGFLFISILRIATFAGHRSIQTTLIYIHLSGRELSQRIARGMAEIHAWRSKMLEDLL